jgi:glycogen synthase
VVTTTAGTKIDEFTFEVIRKPNRKRQIELVKWADIILFNGAGLALQPWVLLYRKPFVWVHQSYLVSCIDGLGWVDGVKAPLHPFPSIKYHIQRKGWVWGITQGLKLLIKRFVALNLVNKNVAITKWVKTIQPLPRQILIYNPFPIDKFISTDLVKPEYDFLFLGRIVSEKGVSTLLQALSKVINSYWRTVNLLIIGDGNWKEKMENLAGRLQITQNITFVGEKSGRNLTRWVAKGKIAIVPSEWYEPMGGVALELMAAGKNLIISEYGGLKECVGNAALTFPNGDDKALAACMIRLLEDEQLCKKQKLEGQERIQFFHPSLFIEQYIDMLKELVVNSR